jgi:branched-chain amino acid transport system substrate-binding protein
MEIAVDELNAAGGIRGRPLELMVINDEDTADGGVRADDALIASGAVALVGHMTSMSASKSVGHVTARKVVLISPTASSTDFSGIDDYFFRVIGPNDEQGRSLAAEALRRGARRAAAAYNSMNRSYTWAVYSGFKETFETGGGIVAPPLEITAQTGFDYASLRDGLLSSDPELVLCIGSSFDVASLRQAMAKAGKVIPTYASMWARTPDLFQFGGRTVEGVLLAEGAVLKSANSAEDEFLAEYKRRYGEEPTFASLYAYESIKILAAALKKSKKYDGPHIKEALESLGPFIGLVDSIELDRYGDTARPYSLTEAKDGEFRPVH